MSKKVRVVLLKDIPGTGHRGEVKSVSAGFAYNHLLPSKLAELATPNVLARLQQEAAQQSRVAQQSHEKAEQLVGKLQGCVVHFAARANDQGKLFGALKAPHIVQALLSAGYAGAREAMLHDMHPITKVGSHDVAVQITPAHQVTVKVVVTAQAEASQNAP